MDLTRVLLIDSKSYPLLSGPKNHTMNYELLEALGRARLSRNFYMREFLYSEIANWHQLRNVPDHPDVALRVGRELCTQLLEPLQMRFGRVHIRSGYRSLEVNEFGNRHDLNCASNEKNFAEHIWDYPDASGAYGAMACVVVPALSDYIALGGSWTAMAWWIHDHLPYSSLCFFSKLGAFNIGWHESPKRRIYSYAAPLGCLTKPHMSNHMETHVNAYRDLLTFVDTGAFHATSTADAAIKAAPAYELRPAPIAHNSSGLPVALDSGPGKRIRYRAVHAKTKWRRADNHASLNNAIHGKDGAAGLFAGQTRIDHELHGEPLFVIVWRDGDPLGKVIRAHPQQAGKVELAEISIEQIELMEARRGASTTELAKYFN